VVRPLRYRAGIPRGADQSSAFMSWSDLLPARPRYQSIHRGSRGKVGRRAGHRDGHPVAW